MKCDKGVESIAQLSMPRHLEYLIEWDWDYNIVERFMWKGEEELGGCRELMHECGEALRDVRNIIGRLIATHPHLFDRS